MYIKSVTDTKGDRMLSTKFKLICKDCQYVTDKVLSTLMYIGYKYDNHFFLSLDSMVKVEEARIS